MGASVLARPEAKSGTSSAIPTWVPTSAAVLAVLMYVTGLLLGIGVDYETGWRRYLWLRIGCCVLAFGLVLFGMWRHRTPHRGPWLLLASLMIAWIMLPVRVLFLAGPPPLQGFYLMFHVALQMIALAGALFWIAKCRRTVADRASMLDIGVMLAGFLAFQLHVGIVPVLGNPRIPFVITLAVIAPIGYVAILVLMGRLLFIEAISGRSFQYLMLAYAATVLPNVFTIFVATGSADSTAIGSIAVDTAPLSVLLIAAAALHPSMVELTRPSPAVRPEWSRIRCLILVITVSLPFTAVLTGPAPALWEAAILVVLLVISLLLLVWRARGAVSAWRSAEQSSRVQSRTDALTGALNRRGAEEYARSLGANDNPRTDNPGQINPGTNNPGQTNPGSDSPRAGRGAYGLAFCDLDDFKRLNDVHGYAVGDQVLIQLVARLRDVLDPGNVISRLGGDEFAIFFQEDDPRTASVELADRIRQAMTPPLTIGQTKISLRISVGLADTDQLAADVPPDQVFPTLLRHADMAMLAAKAAIGTSISRFAPSMDALARREAAVTDAIAGAASAGHLWVEYQAVVGLGPTDRGRWVGAEALLRLATPELGTIAPSEFIPLAERNGQIVELGEWVFRAAVAELATIGDSVEPGFRLAINISARQLAAPGFVLVLEEIATTAPDLLPLLRVEITESALVDDRARALVHRIAGAGYQVALDDFGAEYASLQYLTMLPVRVLKLDRSFISRVIENGTDRAIVRHVLALAADLGIAVVAEGVETDDQADLLTEFGCDYGQGFLWDRPKPGLARFVERVRPGDSERTPHR